VQLRPGPEILGLKAAAKIPAENFKTNCLEAEI
jgi:hypothetical protein